MTTTAAARTVSPTGTTTAAGLLAALGASPGKPLVFELGGRTLVPPGYHVTEVKAVTVEAMDCGGRAGSWRETVVQLWNPGDEAGRGFMTAGKFLSIYGRVAASLPLREDREIRVEYGDAARPAVQYHVAATRQEGDRLVVELAEPAVACKARGARSACCGSEAATPAPAPATACCTPAAGAASRTTGCC